MRVKVLVQAEGVSQLIVFTNICEVPCSIPSTTFPEHTSDPTTEEEKQEGQKPKATLGYRESWKPGIHENLSQKQDKIQTLGTGDMAQRLRVFTEAPKELPSSPMKVSQILLSLSSSVT